MKILYNLGKYKLAKYAILPRFMSVFFIFAFLRSTVVIFSDYLFFALNAIISPFSFNYIDIISILIIFIFLINSLYSAFYLNKNYYSKNIVPEIIV